VIMAMVDMTAERRSVLIIVVEQDNLERMRKADPITLESALQGGLLRPPAYPLDFSVLVGYEEDKMKLYEMAKAARDPKGVAQLFEWLERGRVFDPKQGDGVENARRLSRVAFGNTSDPTH